MKILVFVGANYKKNGTRETFSFI